MEQKPHRHKGPEYGQSILDRTGFESFIESMASPRPTVRSIAAALGLSRATVSNALRGYAGVNAETRQRVQTAADEMGYVQHPFAAQVMSQIRRGAADKEMGTLAVLELLEPMRPAGSSFFHADLLTGVKERAASLGFGVFHCKFGPGSELTLRRLNQILFNRGVRGLVLLPTYCEPDFAELDWSKFTGVYVDYLIQRPALHSVCCDHGITVFKALEQACARGYKRPGLTITRRTNARLHGRWVGAYLGYLNEHPELSPVPPLVVDEVDELNPVHFLPWFKNYQPDVVLSHWTGALKQMKSQGAKIPRTHGFICLNLQIAPANFSGFLQQPKLLGARAAELVVSQLSQGEVGPPAMPSTTMLPPKWREGGTIRNVSLF